MKTIRTAIAFGCSLLIFFGCNRNSGNPVEPAESWIKLTSGVEGKNVASLACMGGMVYAGTDSGAFRSSDNGGHWESISAGLPAGFVRCFAGLGSNLFAGTDVGVYVSTNGGTTWTSAVNGLNSSINAMAVYRNTLFVGTDSGVWNTFDGGVTWVGMNYYPMNSEEVFAVAVREPDIFVGTLGGAYRSSDGGADWTPIDSGFTGNYINVHSFALVGSSVFAALYGKGVYQSADTGGSWVALNTALSGPWVGSLTVIGEILFVTTLDRVLVSWNMGSSWNDTGLTVSTGGIWCLASNSSYLFAGVGGLGAGVWRRAL